MSDRRGLIGGFVHQVMGRFTRDPKFVRGAERVFFSNLSGVRVDADSALKTAAVWACVRYLSQTVAGLPWAVRLPQGVNGSRRVDSGTVAYMIGSRASDEWSSFQFRETMTHWAVMKGNGYAEIERDGSGRPIALHPLFPDYVDVMRDADGVLFYRYNNPNGGGYVDLEPRDVFHLRGFGNDVVGLNVMTYAAQSIGWAQATEIFGANFFSEGMNPSMIISMTKTLSTPARDELRKELEAVHKGAKKGGRVAILDGGMKPEKVSSSAEESQFIETRQHQVEEICRWFGVPPHKVAHLLRATFSNIEHQSIEVVIDAIAPWAKRFEDEADFKLFGSANRAGFYTKMNLKALMKGDMQARASYFQIRRNLGTLNADEIREFEDENPIGGEAGKMYVMQGQYMSLDAIAATSKAAIEKAENPEPPPPVGGPPAVDDDDDEADADLAAATNRLKLLLGELK